MRYCIIFSQSGFIIQNFESANRRSYTLVMHLYQALSPISSKLFVTGTFLCRTYVDHTVWIFGKLLYANRKIYKNDRMPNRTNDCIPNRTNYCMPNHNTDFMFLVISVKHERVVLLLLQFFFIVVRIVYQSCWLQPFEQ